MNSTNTITFPIEHPVDGVAPKAKKSTRRTKSLDDLSVIKNCTLNLRANQSTIDNNDALSPRSKNLLSRMRNAMFPSRKRCPVVATDLDSLQASLDSIETFLKVVESSPQARTLLQKELVRTLQRNPTAA